MAAEPRAAQPPLSPSEARTQPGGSARVAGRIRAVSAEWVELADDLAVVRVHLPAADTSRCETNGHAVVEGIIHWTQAGVDLRNGRLLAIYLPTPGAPETESTRLRSGVGAHLRTRSQLLREVRAFFDERLFLEVDTPTRVPSPGTDVYIDPVASDDYWLITSPELQMKRLLVGGLPRIYQLVHCHRREEQGRWHEPEFLMLEWYEAFTGVAEAMTLTEDLLRHVAQRVRGRAEILIPDGRALSMEEPFERITVRAAFQRFADVEDGIALAERDEDAYFQLLVDRVEPALSALNTPVFLHEYPLCQAALARPVPGKPDVAERFELYAGGVELCNGYGELTDAHAQRQRFERDVAVRRSRGMACPPLDERFLSALMEGLPPCSGNALGVDRLLMLCTGASEIADGQPFPRRWLD